MNMELPFAYEVVKGDDVPARLAALHRAGNCLPVVLGAPARLETLTEFWNEKQSFDDIRQRGLALDVDEWLRKQVADNPEYYSAEGPVSGVSAVPSLMGARDVLTGKFLPQVLVALAELAQPWEVPALLRPGGWNECPAPEVHLAFFKRWHERYGAIVTTITDDIIEFDVARPPSSPEEVERLAWEQFVYCTDIVHQGVNTLANLAVALKGSRNWYFWWD
jgi:hypothetical protein